MTTAQSSCTFAQELQDLGVIIPSNATEIIIDVESGECYPSIMFVLCEIASPNVRKVKAPIIDKDGYRITGKDLYNYLKEVVQLPDETCSFKIHAKHDGIAMVNINAALPRDSFAFAKDFKFKGEGQSFVGEKVRKILRGLNKKSYKASQQCSS